MSCGRAGRARCSSTPANDSTRKVHLRLHSSELPGVVLDSMVLHEYAESVGTAICTLVLRLCVVGARGTAACCVLCPRLSGIRNYFKALEPFLHHLRRGRSIEHAKRNQAGSLQSAVHDTLAACMRAPGLPHAAALCRSCLFTTWWFQLQRLSAVHIGLDRADARVCRLCMRTSM